MLAPLIWVGLGVAAGFGLSSIIVLATLPRLIANAELGLDPAAGLPTFDDAEAAALLEQGA